MHKIQNMNNSRLVKRVCDTQTHHYLYDKQNWSNCMLEKVIQLYFKLETTNQTSESVKKITEKRKLYDYT